MRRLCVLCLALGLAGSLIGGCAVGNRYGFAGVVADVQASGTASVVVATQDLREAVVAGKKTPDFVGLQRGGYGNPFDVTTESGKPLADVVSDAVCASLAQKGFKPLSIIVATTHTPEQIRTGILNQKPQLGLMLYVMDWKSDTFANVGLTYELQLYVIDGAGNQIAQSTVSGDEDLGGSAWNPPKHARKAVPEAFRDALERLLNHDAVRAALSVK